MSPTHLIMRDRKTGKPVSVSIESVPEEIRPYNWYENPYWMYLHPSNPLRVIVEKYVRGWALSALEAYALAQYIVDYACHIAVMGYLMGGEEALEFNVEVIQRLRAMGKVAKTWEDITDMISVGMEYALDPF